MENNIEKFVSDELLGLDLLLAEELKGLADGVPTQQEIVDRVQKLNQLTDKLSDGYNSKFFKKISQDKSLSQTDVIEASKEYSKQVIDKITRFAAAYMRKGVD